MDNSNDNLKSREAIGTTKISSRRLNKPLIEKKRRARINSALRQLQNLLMQNGLADVPAKFGDKMEKADILERTVKHLKLLQNRFPRTRNGSTQNMGSSYLDGFRTCALEAARYLGICCVPSDIKAKLIRHLDRCIRSMPVSVFDNNYQCCETTTQSVPVVIGKGVTSFPGFFTGSFVPRVATVGLATGGTAPLGHLEEKIFSISQTNNTRICRSTQVQTKESKLVPSYSVRNITSEDNLNRPIKIEKDDPVVKVEKEESVVCVEQGSIDNVQDFGAGCEEDRESVWRPW